MNLSLIMQFEGLSLKAYPDPATGGEPWTIGYGCTHYPSGMKVKKGDSCTKKEAMDYLSFEVQNVYQKPILDHLKVPLKPNQLDALTSLCYNIGWGNLYSSTLWKCINLSPYHRAIGVEWLKWNKVKGVELKGLTNRRKKELDYYFSV